VRDVVIVSAVRTPIGRFMGSLKDIEAVDLGKIVVREAIKRAGILPGQVEDVVGGMVYKGGAKGNPARQVQLGVGIPKEASAVTVDQQCVSAMRAFEIASQQIMLGKSDISVAFGMESMSRTPYVLMGAREGLKMGHGTVYDCMLRDALEDAFLGYHMAITAENLAEQYQISREEQDELAYTSHKRAADAIRQGKFIHEIVPVETKVKKQIVVFDTDEHVRMDISLNDLAKLRPAFKQDGTVTAGNASGVNDGAAAMVLMSKEKAAELGIKPLARIRATASFGVAPEVMGIGPVGAIRKALKYANLELNDIDYLELNEAFAAQVLAVNRELKLDMEKVNANGSGIGLGHPVGCTGIRIMVTMLHEMIYRGVKLGVASLCAGGGPAMATVLERF